MRFTSKPISTTCLEYSFGSIIDKSTSDLVLKVYSFLPKLIDFKEAGIIDIVPSYTALAIHFNTSSPLLKDSHAYDRIIQQAMEEKSTITPNEHIIYVDYNGEDIPNTCRQLNLSKHELIDLHTSCYTIAMIGFREHFPYLLGLDKRLYIPRRDSPRSKVKKGSVAIAAGQTGVYPNDLPGGWHIIGHTDFDDFTALKPGDVIIFKEKEKHADQL